MCDECPTLEKLEPYIQSSRLYWAGSGENEKDREVRDGWVFWIFRTALAQAGYYTDGETVQSGVSADSGRAGGGHGRGTPHTAGDHAIPPICPLGGKDISEICSAR